MDSNDASRRKDMDTIVDELLAFDQTYGETQSIYSQWAKAGSYDHMLEGHEDDYAGPALIKKMMQKLFPRPDNTLIFDLGAGSGIIGSLLRRLGFNDIDALEPCKEFVEILNKKNIYNKTMEQYIGGGAVVPADDDTYDAVVTVGTFCPGHIPCDALHEIIRVLKPGGYFINCMREEFIYMVPEYKDRLVPLMDQLDKDGKWKKVNWEPYKNHYLDKGGIAMVFQKC